MPSLYREAAREFQNHPNALKDEKQAGVPLRQILLNEEFRELMLAIDLNDREKIAREMADLVYVIFGTAEVFDINLDLAFYAVHRANMAKMNAGCRREDGKIVKPPDFVPPNMGPAIT